MELPLSKIKRIAKFDPDVSLVSTEAAVALTFATEYFIKYLSQKTVRQTQMTKRKTLQMKDMENALRINSCFEFLDGVLETFKEDDSDLPSSKEGEHVLASPQEEGISNNLIDSSAELQDNVVLDEHVQEQFKRHKTDNISSHEIDNDNVDEFVDDSEGLLDQDDIVTFVSIS